MMRTDIHRRIDSAEDAVSMLRDAHAHVCNPSTNCLPKSLKPPRFRLGWIATAALFLLVVAATAVSVSYFGAHGDAKIAGQESDTAGSQAVAFDAEDFSRDAWWDSAAEAELHAIQIRLNELAIEMDADTPSDTHSQTQIDSKNRSTIKGEHP
jgi:hypothetical protein